MRGAVIYLTNEEIAKSIKSSFEDKSGYEFDLLKFGEGTEESLLNYNYVVSEWGLRNELLPTLISIPRNTKVAFFNSTFVSDIDETSNADKLLQDALQAKNYSLCKIINEFYRFGDVIRKRTVLKSLPTVLQLETTDLCNARCIMCRHAYETGTGTDILQSGLIERIQPILPFVETIILHGNGEPFILKDIGSYLKKLSEYNVRFITNTNLSIINDAIIDLLNESFIELNVSCDGYDRESYEMIRRGLDFDTFVANCRKVRERCPHLRMKMAVVVMRQNMDYLSKITEFASELGFDEVAFNQLCADERLNNYADSPYLYREKFIVSLKEVRETADRLKIKVKTPVVSLDECPCADNDDSTDNTGVFKGICDWLVGQVFINLNGDLAVCCINQRNIAGNVFKQDVREIWNCDKYQNERKLFSSGQIPQNCLGCDFLIQNKMRFLIVKSKLSFEQLKKDPV